MVDLALIYTVGSYWISIQGWSGWTTLHTFSCGVQSIPWWLAISHANSAIVLCIQRGEDGTGCDALISGGVSILVTGSWTSSLTDASEGISESAIRTFGHTYSSRILSKCARRALRHACLVGPISIKPWRALILASPIKGDIVEVAVLHSRTYIHASALSWVRIWAWWALGNTGPAYVLSEVSV